MSMKVKWLACISGAALLTVGVAAFFGISAGSKGGLIGEGVYRIQADIECDDFIYLDDEAIALSDASGYNTELRAQALEAAELVNQIRESRGVQPLTWDSNLESVSAVRSEECSMSFSHVRPSGKAWNTVNSKIQGGENLAFGFDNAQDAVDAWMGSPTHADNITYSQFTKGAIAIYQADDGTMYWAQEFGYK